MPEPVTTIGLGALAAYVSKDGISKLLGPTAEYLGVGLKDFTEARAKNLGQIFSYATQKLKNKLDVPGEVPPKVLKAILEEGAYCTDPLAQKYFGGVLASSRSETGKDDRGARLAKLIERLSTYQLRSHYLIYSSIRQLFLGKGLSMNMNDRPKMQIYIPFSAYVPAMEFDQNDLRIFTQLLPHTFFGLHSENLIEGQFQYGPKESLARIFKDVGDDGVICQPSALGTELFLWALGVSDQELDYIFDPQLNVQKDGICNGVINAQATKV